MWVAKFKNWHKNCLIRPLCVKYHVTDLVYVLNYWEEEKHFIYTELHALQGTQENIKQFIKEMKAYTETQELIIQGNNILTKNKVIKQEEYKHVFNNKIIYVEPIIQRSDGYEDWKIASWDKEELMNIINISVFENTITYIKKLDVAEIFLPKLAPKLAPKQKEAIQLAVQQGYYSTPRKATIKQLAEQAGIQPQTFHQALTTAENKMIQFLTENKYSQTNQ